MSDLPVIWMAPFPGAHKTENRQCVYVHRPAEYSRGRGSVTAFKVEAYVPGHALLYSPTLSKPIFTVLVYVTADHRATWDARTRGRTGNVATLNTLIEYVQGPDAERLRRGISEALSAIEAWEASR